MISPEEAAFIAEFQPRLRGTREAMNWSQKRFAKALGVGYDAYKKYESRPDSAFPLYLIPKLIDLTGRPVHFWLGLPPGEDERRGRARLSVVNRQ